MAVSLMAGALAWAAPSMDSPPLAKIVKTQPKRVAEGEPIMPPLVTWGGDVATILANGNGAVTAQGSIFAQQG